MDWLLNWYVVSIRMRDKRKSVKLFPQILRKQKASHWLMSQKKISIQLFHRQTFNNDAIQKKN